MIDNTLQNLIQKYQKLQKILLLLIVCLWLGVSQTVPAQAALSLSNLEQQINIINGEFASTDTSYTPTNNSLGLVAYNSANYSGPTTYFEVVIRCVGCTGGNERAVVALYSSDGTLQTTLNSTSSTYERLRTGSLVLPAGDYTIRLQRDATAGTAYVKAARLIVVQSAGPITQTQTQVEVGHYENRTVTAASSLTAPKYYRYDHSVYSGTINAYFEASLRTAGNSIATTYYFDDYDSGGLEWSTNPSNMTNNSVATFASTSTDSQVQRLTSNSATSSDNGEISTVELRVYGYQTNGSDGQVRLRPRFGGSTNGSYYDYVLPENSGSADWSSYFDITADGSAPSTWSWSDVDNLDVDVTFDKGADGNNTAFVSLVQVRVTHADTSKVVYAQLYNRTNSAVVTTLSTSNQTTTRLRSDALSTNWDTLNADEYEVRLYTSDSDNPVYLANAKIIIDQNQTGGIARAELVHHMVTTTRQQTNSIYTQETYYNRFTPASFSGTNVVRAFFEVTMSTSVNGTSYAALYDREAADVIDDPNDSELTLFDASTALRVRSPNIRRNTDWPTVPSDITTILKTDDGFTTTIHNSVLIIQAEAMLPELSFTITGMASGVTNNGITTNITTTISTLPFGNLGISSPKYGAFQLEVETNEALSGYVVYTYLADPFQGYYPANFIDPFVGGGATWTSPQLWITPTGTSANNDTGWIGANTSDTRVTGWSSGFARFGPIDTSPVEVMRSNTGDTSDTVYVTFGIEVNDLQPADTYYTNLYYDILATY